MTITREQVIEAMQDAWNEFCSDSGTYPDCIFRHGGLLFADFGRGNYAQWVADRLNRMTESGTSGYPGGES